MNKANTMFSIRIPCIIFEGQDTHTKTEKSMKIRYGSYRENYLKIFTKTIKPKWK